MKKFTKRQLIKRAKLANKDIENGDIVSNSAIQQLRKIRDKIGIEIEDMSFEELKKYIDEKSKIFPKMVWQKKTITSK